MNITYNNLYSPSDLLTFSDVPNILKLKENIHGYEGTFSFFFSGNLASTVTANSQYHVTFLDETVTNVMNPEDAKNKYFYISSDPSSTAASFAQALRNCSSLMADFTIGFGGNEVELKGRTLGDKWTNVPHYLDTNIPSPYLTYDNYPGTAEPSDVFMSKVLVDVVKYYDDNSSQYVTTLEKTFYGNECGFNMSPILSTFSEYGKTNKYRFIIGTISQDGTYYQRGSMSGFTTCGYEANQSDRYKYLNTVELALNTNRNQVRYIYGTKLDYSILWGGNTSQTITYSLKNSTLTEIYSTTETFNPQSYTSHIVDKTWTIPNTYKNIAVYLDVTIGNKTVRFKVIKPLKATEYFQRVYWRNEYGGIEFFDFTGSRTESDNLDISTYEKNIYDFYEAKDGQNRPIYEQKKIYSNDYKKSVKLTSHLLEENGKWFANSLARSKKVWTEINGRIHYIIPKSVEVSEDNTYNNIYTATLTYEYSDLS